ncbi:excinuclease ABC subunit UvrC [Neiella marina]|uniref:UvrABC system protein C n=1 Tax=Neiella holothuriorum TaxID=2870530 RepID=A0ABS7EFU4_9GAMM|nr:excinuclease ABC subunit UvrC [Neiella holothuriorum]MBW8190661.1 excinuclease ABC subunit UvrC [Neiella holothuriorum]
MSAQASEFDSKSFLRRVTQSPGVYRMYDAEQQIIYVGKAKNLKNRLSSYFRSNQLNRKTKALVSQIANVDVTVTLTEADALILENNLIKAHRPRYNVLMRDDKSYPYIFLSDHQHPRLAFHRGPKRHKGSYFGPFPSGGAVRHSLKLLQKVFAVRQCEDSYYANRSRPCLQYQLKRCSGPCVPELVSEADYQQQVRHTQLFLQGKHQQLIDQLMADMEQASMDLAFEQAAIIRDQIQSLRTVQEQQGVSGETNEIDVFASAYEHGMCCIQVLSIRNGQLLGSRSYFPKIPSDTALEEIIESFIMQYYLSHNSERHVPAVVVLELPAERSAIVSEALCTVTERQIHLRQGQRGESKKYLELAKTNASSTLANKLADRTTAEQRFRQLQQLLELEQPIHRMECFDISHTQGDQTVASCVVFNAQGPANGEYRRYNISGITAGDDYAAMAQVLTRRFKKLDDPSKVPDVLIVDGGKGQLGKAQEVLEQVEWPEQCSAPLLIGIKKGDKRKAQFDSLLLSGTWEVIAVDATEPAMHLVQHIRDEAHRFAISGHRQQRGKAKRTSSLEQIPGVGDKRRQALLKNFGGLQGIKAASVDALNRVPGISKALAQQIYDHFHPE